MSNNSVFSYIEKVIESLDIKVDLKIVHNQLVASIYNNSDLSLLKFFQFLVEDQKCLFLQLMDITAVDYLNLEENYGKRFSVVYHLLSLKHNNRIRIKIAIEDQQSPPSIHSIFSNAVWYEREIWDLYGISFSNCPDMRRILTDYNFTGFPLRKDFPLTGYEEVRYDTESAKVVYEPVSLMQEYRNFDALSPWEGENIEEKK